MVVDGSRDEGGALKSLQADFKALAAFFEPVAKARVTEPEFLEKVEAALKKWPDAQSISRAVDEVRTKAEATLQAVRTSRVEKFRRVEAEYIQALQESKRALRETASGWRVGCLQVEMQRVRARVRFKYDNEVLVDWTSVERADDLVRLEAKATALLDSAQMPDELVCPAVVEAYEAAARHMKQKSLSAERVPIDLLYRFFRLQLVARELEKKVDKSIRSDFPRYAFSYTLDRYRQAVGRSGMRDYVSFQTGSQVESGRIGWYLNGLDPSRDYQVVCYAIRVGDHDAGERTVL